MGVNTMNVEGCTNGSERRTHQVFLLLNYLLLGSASACIFLTLSLRLLPSLSGLSLILLHSITIAGAISGCVATSEPNGKWYGTHMVTTVLTAIFQGATAVMIFTRTGDFLGYLKSYVKEDDGAVILKLAGGLSIVMFCVQWVLLTLAFSLKYHTCSGNGGVSSPAMRSSKVAGTRGEDDKDWPWPFQV